MDTESNIWSLTYEQLAAQCRAIADGKVPLAGPDVRTEAERLYSSWLDALASAGDNYEEFARKGALQASLRKRTIEILVKLASKR